VVAILTNSSLGEALELLANEQVELLTQSHQLAGAKQNAKQQDCIARAHRAPVMKPIGTSIPPRGTPVPAQAVGLE